MKALRKCLYLILGLFIFGLVSCANDSSSNDTYVPARNTDTDKNGQKYTDGFYKFDDGNTQMYLYYENRNLVSAGNTQGKFDSNRVEILKQSYPWNTVCKYCTRYEVSLNSTKWMLGVYPAEKLFKKGWYRFNIKNDAWGTICGYFESYDNQMIYTVEEKWSYNDNKGIPFRTNNFKSSNGNYSSDTWSSLLNRVANSDYFSAGIDYLSENLEYYPEESSLSK